MTVSAARQNPADVGSSVLRSRLLETGPPPSRPGRRFAAIEERELYPALRDLASRLPKASGGIVVIAEMTGPTGLPDLVAVPVTPRLEQRLQLATPPVLSWSDARLAAACSTVRPFSLHTLARRVGEDEGATRRRAQQLVRTGALLSIRSGYVRASALDPIGRIYALEAKVDDWSAGLGQALRYGSWADASAAVLGKLPKDHSRAVDQARQLGLGLALGATWLVRPRVRRLAFAKRFWASEHVVAAILGSE